MFINMSASVRDGSLNLLAKNYTANELNCVKHLARSGHVLAQGNNTHEPRLNRVHWFAVPTVVWFSGPPVVRPLADYNAQLMYQVLVKIANDRRESAAFVNGFTRACSLFCQIGPGNAPIARRVFYNCLGEVTSALRWPGIKDSNWMYRLLDLMPLKSEADEGFVTEYARLLTCGVEDLYNLAPTVGSLLSAGFGLSLHAHITGRDLCRMAVPNLRAQSPPLSGLAEYLFPRCSH